MELQISLVVLLKRFVSTDTLMEETTNSNSNKLRVAAIRRFLNDKAAALASCCISHPFESMSRRLQIQNQVKSKVRRPICTLESLQD
jgi:hypothetical protein